MTKLNHLRISIYGDGVKIPEGIAALKRLRNLTIYTPNNTPVNMPKDLKELDKLKNLRINGWVNKQEFSELSERIKK